VVHFEVEKMVVDGLIRFSRGTFYLKTIMAERDKRLLEVTFSGGVGG